VFISCYQSLQSYHIAREANNNGQREASNGLIGPRIANLGLRGSVGFEPCW
jgi:hypothetical protein